MFQEMDPSIHKNHEEIQSEIEEGRKSSGEGSQGKAELKCSKAKF